MDRNRFSDALSIWNPLPMDSGTCFSWTLGDLTLWVERYEHEWHTLSLYQTAQEQGEKIPEAVERSKTEKPESSDWKHYLLRQGDTAVPVPVMPDRPVLIRPDRYLVLLPGESAQFFVFLPVWVCFQVGLRGKSSNPRPLFDVPITRLRNAWFGDPISGELCYFTATRLYPDYRGIPPSPLHALCPLRIKNESSVELPFERICLHTEFFSLYYSNSRLWTNASEVLFKGPDQFTQIEPAKTPPAFDGAVKLLSPPRQAADKWYFTKTFNLLKFITGF